MEESFRETYRQAMRELGYVEGRTVVTEHRFGEGRADRLRELALELASMPVDVIVTSGTPATVAAKQATRTIPIVFAASSDPVGAGIVASLAQPEGNVTGLSLMSSDLSQKRLEIVSEALSQLNRATILWDISNPGMTLRVQETQLAADRSRIELVRLGVRSPDELESALGRLSGYRPDAVLVLAGGLMSYGPDIRDNFRQAASYVDKILKGAKPAELPVSQPSKFELVVNLRTAKAIGLDIPRNLLLRADEVVQ